MSLEFIDFKDTSSEKIDDPLYHWVISTFQGTQGKEFIKQHQLDKNETLKKLHGVCDGAALVSSMTRAAHNLQCADQSLDHLHVVLLNPLVRAGMAAFAAVIVPFSFLASFNKNVANNYSLLRELCKGAKNMQKVLQVALMALNLVYLADLRYLLGSVGIAVCTLAGLNRLLLRQTYLTLKQHTEDNDNLLQAILKKPKLSEQEKLDFLKKIKYQQLDYRNDASLELIANAIDALPTEQEKTAFLNSITHQTYWKKISHYVSQTINAIVDGGYLYLGPLALLRVNPEVFKSLATRSSGYAAGCVPVRFNETYDKQCSFFESQLRCEMALMLLDIKECLNEHGQVKEPDKLKIKMLLEQLQDKQNKLNARFKSNRPLALIIGLTNGLAAYGALNSMVFFVAPFFMPGNPIISSLVSQTIQAGVGIITTFVLHALMVDHYLSIIQSKPFYNIPYDLPVPTNATELHSRLAEIFREKPVVKYFFNQWFEVLRSWFAGGGKVRNIMGILFNTLQKLGADGHYHDHKLVSIITAISTLFVSAIFALRALVKGLETPKEAKLEPLSCPEIKKSGEPDTNIMETSDTSYQPIQTAEPVNESRASGSGSTPSMQQLARTNLPFFGDTGSTVDGTTSPEMEIALT